MSRKVGFIAKFVGLSALAVVGVTAAGTLTGCAVAPTSTSTVSCSGYPHQTVVPATAVADHNAAAPGNQQQFAFPLTQLPVGCAQAQYLVLPTWVSSDTVNAPISNTPPNIGVATCMGSTTTPVTISTTQEGSASVGRLTCK
jgi:hypothetical protein